MEDSIYNLILDFVQSLETMLIALSYTVIWKTLKWWQTLFAYIDPYRYDLKRLISQIPFQHKPVCAEMSICQVHMIDFRKQSSSHTPVCIDGA